MARPTTDRELRRTLRFHTQRVADGAAAPRIPLAAARAGGAVGGSFRAGDRTRDDRRIPAGDAARLAPRCALVRRHRGDIVARARAAALSSVATGPRRARGTRDQP